LNRSIGKDSISCAWAYVKQCG